MPGRSRARGWVLPAGVIAHRGVWPPVRSIRRPCPSTHRRSGHPALPVHRGPDRRRRDRLGHPLRRRSGAAGQSGPAPVRPGLARARLVPVLIEQVRPPMGFRSVQACDLSDWEGDPAAAEFVALTRAISNLVGPPPKGAPVQSSTPLPPAESPRRGIRRYAWGVAVVMAASVLAVVGMWRWGSPAPTPVPLPVSVVVESSPPPIAPPEPDRIPAPSPAPLGNGARVAKVPEAALPAAPKPEVPTLEVPKAPPPKPLAAPRIAPKAETRLSSSTLSASCTAVLERMQLGEPVSDSERKECTR